MWIEKADGTLVRAPAPATKTTRRQEPLNTDTTAGRASSRDDQAYRGSQVAGREAERLARRSDRATERRDAEVRADSEAATERRERRRALRREVRAQRKQARVDAILAST